MFSLVFTILLFSVNIQFSYQKVQVELFKKKYDYVLTEIFKDIENICESVIDTRHGKEMNIINIEEHISKQSSQSSNSSKLPGDLSRKLTKIEKGIRAEKHVSRRKWRDFQTKYETEVCKCNDTSSLIDQTLANIIITMDNLKTEQVLLRSEKDQLRTDQITQQTEQDQLRSDQVKLRSDQDTLQNTITENASNVTHELMEMNERLNREMDQMRNETIKLNEVIVSMQSNTDTLANKLTDINEMYDKVKNDLYYYRMNVRLKQNGWVEHSNSMYKAFDEKMSWSDAMDKCKSESDGKGLLVEIQNMNEANFVNGLVKNHREFWLGGCDKDTEGLWKWCGSGNSMTFENWRNNEPNNSGGNEDCLNDYSAQVSGSEGKWNDIPCSHQLAFVCEIVV